MATVSERGASNKMYLTEPHEQPPV